MNSKSQRIISIDDSNKYVWGENCTGWHLLNLPSLSVIEESIPPGAGEVLHFHHHSVQFFYILEGEAGFLIEGQEFKLKSGEGIGVLPGEPHKIFNCTLNALRFLVISHPHAHGDRVTL